VDDRQQRTVEPVDEHVMLPPRPLAARKGRGAVSNLQGRYEVDTREAVDDGWSQDGCSDAGGGAGGDGDGDDTGAGNPDSAHSAPPPARLRTIVTDEVAKTILSRNASPDIPFNVSLNPYRGCEHEM
jgi:hypothetical protein